MYPFYVPAPTRVKGINILAFTSIISSAIYTVKSKEWFHRGNAHAALLQKSYCCNLTVTFCNPTGWASVSFFLVFLSFAFFPLVISLLHLREKTKKTWFLIINVIHLISLINYETLRIFRNHSSLDFLDFIIQYEASTFILVHSSRAQQFELCMWMWKTLWYYTVVSNNSNSGFFHVYSFSSQ